MKSLKSLLLNEGKSISYYAVYVDVDPNDSTKRKYIAVEASEDHIKEVCERWKKRYPEDKSEISWYSYNINDFFEF